LLHLQFRRNDFRVLNRIFQQSGQVHTFQMQGQLSVIGPRQKQQFPDNRLEPLQLTERPRQFVGAVCICGTAFVGVLVY
jgi:hypothetical protein